MGLFNFFKRTRTENEQLHGFISNPQGISFEEAKQLRESFLAIAEQDDESAAFNAASDLMLSKAFSECIQAYKQLSEKYPNRQGDCYSQIGAAYYFLEDYEQAIRFYVLARDSGADEDMMDDNIWEACETIYRKKNNKSAIEKYKELCPNGNYLKQANKLLSSN
jgi:tetratricopeptide (TPR) repeat protein